MLSIMQIFENSQKLYNRWWNANTSGGICQLAIEHRASQQTLHLMTTSITNIVLIGMQS